MNWVGGVRRRVLLQEEEKRCQDQYFAAHASSARQRSRVLQGRNSNRSECNGCPGKSVEKQYHAGPLQSRPRIGTHHWKNEEMVCERIKRNSTFTAYTFQKGQNVTEGNPSTRTHQKRKSGRLQSQAKQSEKKNVWTSRVHQIKYASIHGPFSKFLLKLEMQGIEKRFSKEELQRSEGGLSQNLDVGKLVEEQEHEKGNTHVKSDVSRHNEGKKRNDDDSKKCKITKCNRSKDDRNISKYSSNMERKKSKNEKVKDEETTVIQNRSKSDRNKLYGIDRNKNADQPESEETISQSESQQNTTNEKSMKQSDSRKGKMNTCCISTKERMNRQEAKENELKEGPHKTDNLKKTKSDKWKRRTNKTEDNSKGLDFLHNGVTYQKHFVKVSNKNDDEKEQHINKKKKHKNITMHGSFRQSVTDMKCKASDSNAPEVKLIKKDKMSTKENIYSRVRKTEKGKHEQDNQDTFQKSDVKVQSCTNKQKTVNNIRTSNLLSGAPRLRQLLTLSPERHKGKIWVPLNLPKEPSDRDKTEAVSSSDGNQNNTVKQGNVNTENDNATGKFKQNLIHHKQECIDSSRTLKNKQNSEWEKKRIAILFGSQLKTPPTECSDSYNNYNYIDEKESEDTGVHKLSFNKSANSLIANPLEEGKEDLKTKHSEIHMNDDLIFGIQNSDEFNNEAVSKDSRPAVRRLGKRKLQVIHVNSDNHEEKIVQKWQTSGKSKPKFSTLSRKLVKIESGLNFAHKRKDKTPYLDKSFTTPWNSNTIINTPSSSMSSKTPPDPTLERLLEDPAGSQEGMEQHNTISDHAPDLSPNFENHEMQEKLDRTVLLHTSENESHRKGVRLSSNSLTDQLQLFKSNLGSAKGFSSSISSVDKTHISESDQILKKCHIANDQSKDKVCTYVEDTSTSRARDCNAHFENPSYLCINSSQSPVNTMDKSLHMKQHGEIKMKSNAIESKISLSENSAEGRDIQSLYTDTFSVHPVQVANRDVSSESLGNLNPRLQMQMNNSAVSQEASFKKYPSQNLREDFMSSSTSVREGLQMSVNEVISTHFPCKEVVALQVSHSEISDKSNNNFRNEMFYEQTCNGLFTQSLSTQDSVQPTNQFGDFPKMIHTVRHASPTNISSISSQQNKGEVPKMFMVQENMQNFACNGLDSSEKRDLGNVTPTVCEAEGNVLKGIFYSNFLQDPLNYFDMKSNSKELQELMITRREPFGYLEMPLVPNHCTIDYDHILRERVVGDLNEVSKQYEAQNYISHEKEENFEKNIYIENRNIENTECDKESSHANCIGVAFDTGSKSVHDEITKQNIGVSLMTKRSENGPLYCIEENSQMLSSGEEVHMKCQQNRKDGRGTVSGFRDLLGGAKNRGESFNEINQKRYSETPIEFPLQVSVIGTDL